MRTIVMWVLSGVAALAAIGILSCSSEETPIGSNSGYEDIQWDLSGYCYDVTGGGQSAIENVYVKARINCSCTGGGHDPITRDDYSEADGSYYIDLYWPPHTTPFTITVTATKSGYTPDGTTIENYYGGSRYWDSNHYRLWDK